VLGISLHSGPGACSIVSAAQMSQMDSDCIKGGTPALELMERAGRAIFDTLSCCALDLENAVILCGKGNNGGDGLVLARLMQSESLSPRVVLISSSGLSIEAAENLKAALKVGVTCYCFGSESEDFEDGVAACSADKLKSLLHDSKVVVDALLGTGQSATPTGAIRELLEQLGSRSELFQVAIDLPTGMNADTGEVYEPALRADRTLCIQNLKSGMLHYPARKLCGDIRLLDIGISGYNISKWQLVRSETIPKIPKRVDDCHKGHFGHVVVIGGSRITPGAPLLSATAALFCGSGLVSVTSWPESRTAVPPELMVLPVELAAKGCIDLDSLKREQSLLSKATVLAVGPGLIDGALIVDYLVQDHLKDKTVPMVIDADALDRFGQIPDDVRARASRSTVFTPHPGEAARLLGVSTTEVQSDRCSAAEALQDKLGGVVILKGANPLVRTEEGGFIFDRAEPNLATGGSGDVLTGIIAGLLAQGLSTVESAILGLAIQLRVARIARGRSIPVLPAGEQIKLIPLAISQFTEH